MGGFLAEGGTKVEDFKGSLKGAEGNLEGLEEGLKADLKGLEEGLKGA